MVHNELILIKNLCVGQRAKEIRLNKVVARTTE